MTIKTYENIDQALQQVTQETPAPAIEQVRGMIDSNAQLAEVSFIDERREKHEQAKAVAETFRERLANHRSRMQEIERKLGDNPAGNALRALLFLTGSTACMVTEVTLSLSLPFLLNVQERSFLGIMMGLAMACAVLILDYVAEKLGFLASPWELLRSAVPSRFWRVVACAASVAVLLAVAGLNLYTIGTLSPTREEAAKLRHNIAAVDKQPIPVDEAKVGRAVFWFSITVTIGAALLLVVGTTDLRRLCRRGALRVEAWRLDRRGHYLAEEYNRAAAVLASRQAEWERASADARHAAELMRSAHLFRLEQALRPKARPKPSALEAIDETFHRRSSGAA